MQLLQLWKENLKNRQPVQWSNGQNKWEFKCFCFAFFLSFTPDTYAIYKSTADEGWFLLSRHFSEQMQVKLMHVNEIEAMYGRSCVNVKVEPRSTFMLTCSLLTLTHFIYAHKFYVFWHGKILRQWKSTLTQYQSKFFCCLDPLMERRPQKCTLRNIEGRPAAMNRWNPWCPVMIYIKRVRVSSRPGAKVRHQGPQLEHSLGTVLHFRFHLWA